MTLGIEPAGRLVVHAEPFGHTGPHVVVDDVDGLDQPVGDLQALGRLEVGARCRAFPAGSR